MNVQQIIAVIREVQRQNNERNIPATLPIGMRVEDAIALADYIERLEAVVRAAENYIDIFNMHKVGRMGAAADAYHAARSRVNLSTTSNSSPSSQAALDNSVSDGNECTDKCGPDCTLEVLRPGQVQCNRDGAKCPNKEASDGN